MEGVCEGVGGVGEGGGYPVAARPTLGPAHAVAMGFGTHSLLEGIIVFWRARARKL